jgi:chemotaxis protein histidine kinase CheA
MKTVAKNATAVQGTAAKANQTANRIENRPSLTQKEAKDDEKTKNQAPAETSQVETGKTTEVKTGSTATVDNQPANAATQPAAAAEVKEEPKAETTNVEEAKAEPKKFALNLEQTLKSVDDLHRLSIQRLALIARIKTLEAFEVKLIEENDELEANPYQGCKLIIKDDKGREFVTNTPNLIRMVSQFIFDACHEKLTGIEANIIFPNA